MGELFGQSATDLSFCTIFRQSDTKMSLNTWCHTAGTMLLVGTFLVAYDRRRRVQSDTINVLAPWMLGVAVTAAHLYLTPFTWCSINPGTCAPLQAGVWLGLLGDSWLCVCIIGLAARSFGAAVISGFWSDHWVRIRLRSSTL